MRQEMSREKMAELALGREGMMTCLVMRCTMSISQCLVNQKRALLYPETMYSLCRKCQTGKNLSRQGGEKPTLRAVRRDSWSEPAARLKQKMAGDWRPRIRMVLDLGERLRRAGWPKTRVTRATSRLHTARRRIVEELWRLGQEEVAARAAERLRV